MNNVYSEVNSSIKSDFKEMLNDINSLYNKVDKMINDVILRNEIIKMNLSDFIDFNSEKYKNNHSVNCCKLLSVGRKELNKCYTFLINQR